MLKGKILEIKKKMVLKKKKEKKISQYNQIYIKLLKNSLKYKKKNYIFRKIFKRQKRFSIIYKTLKVFNKFYEKGGEPQQGRKWRIRKPFFLMSFFLRRYIRRYYGRIRNNKINFLYKKYKKKENFFLRYFESLESLLPVFLTRIGLVKNPMLAKDFIKKGKIFINFNRMYNSNYILKKGDLISFDSSLFGVFYNKRFVDRYLRVYAFFFRKWKLPKIYRYRLYYQMRFKSKHIRRFLFQKKKYNFVKFVLKQYHLYLKIKIGKENFFKPISKIVLGLVFKKIFLKSLLFVEYKRKVSTIRVRRKIWMKMKMNKMRKGKRFYRKTFKPFNIYMAAGFSCRFRLRLSRFLLNVEHSHKTNKFIYMHEPLWENINMYVFNTTKSLDNRYANVLKKDMFFFFLNNFKKSII